MPKILVKTTNPLAVVDIQKVRNALRSIDAYVDFNELNCSNVVFEYKDGLSFTDLVLYVGSRGCEDYIYSYYEDEINDTAV